MAAIESLGDVESPAGLLRCTLRAFENINSFFGSFGEAYRRVSQMDALAITTVVSEAQGKTVLDLKETVWRVGPQSLIEPVGKYLTMLSNGGKMPADAGEDAPKGEA